MLVRARVGVTVTVGSEIVTVTLSVDVSCTVKVSGLLVVVGGAEDEVASVVFSIVVEVEAEIEVVDNEVEVVSFSEDVDAGVEVG